MAAFTSDKAREALRTAMSSPVTTSPLSPPTISTASGATSSSFSSIVSSLVAPKRSDVTAESGLSAPTVPTAFPVSTSVFYTSALPSTPVHPLSAVPAPAAAVGAEPSKKWTAIGATLHSKNEGKGKQEVEPPSLPAKLADTPMAAPRVEHKREVKVPVRRPELAPVGSSMLESIRKYFQGKNEAEIEFFKAAENGDINKIIDFFNDALSATRAPYYQTLSELRDRNFEAIKSALKNRHQKAAVEIIRCDLAKSKSLNQCKHAYESFFKEGLENDYADLVEYLISASLVDPRSSLSIYDKNFYTSRWEYSCHQYPFFIACRSGSEKVVRLLLSLPPVAGHGELYVACACGCGIMRRKIATVEITDGQYGFEPSSNVTVLEAGKKYHNITALILSHFPTTDLVKISVNATGVFLAARHDHLELLEELLFTYNAPRDKIFLDYLQKDSTKWKWLQLCLSLSDSLKSTSLPKQLLHLNAALIYTGNEVERVKTIVVDLLLRHLDNRLLSHSEIDNRLLLDAWCSWIRQHQTEKAGASVLKIEEAYWSQIKSKHFCLAFIQNPCHCLCITQSKWDVHGWRSFLTGITNSRMTTLDLSHNGLNDAQLEELAEALQSNKTITHCILDRNQLTLLGLTNILKALFAHPTLTHLSVRENLIAVKHDKRVLDEKIGATLIDHPHLQTVDISGNYLVSESDNIQRRVALRQLLLATGFTVKEFAETRFVKDEESKSPKHRTLTLEVGEAKLEVKREVSMVALQELSKCTNENPELATDGLRWADLQKGLPAVLRRYPELENKRITDITAYKEQKQFCKQLLFFHPKAPLKSYIKSHARLFSASSTTAYSLLLPRVKLTPQNWQIYFAAKKVFDPRDEHAMLIWEGVYSYGQRVIEAFDLITTSGKMRVQAAFEGEGFNIQRVDSFLKKHYLVAFDAAKKDIKHMEKEIRDEVGMKDGVYKKIIFRDEGHVNNCQKWALEKIQKWLKLDVKKCIAALPSSTASNLQALPQAFSLKPKREEKSKMRIYEMRI